MLNIKWFSTLLMIIFISNQTNAQICFECLHFYSNLHCAVKENPRVTKSNLIINCSSSKSYISLNDMETFLMSDMTMNFFPINFGSVFSKLKILSITSSNLLEINKSDIELILGLEQINLESNGIKIIKKELFEMNLNLEVINLNKNAIIELHPDTFDNLMKLKSLKIMENICVKNFVVESHKVLMEQKYFLETCRKKDMSTTFLPSTSTTLITESTTPNFSTTPKISQENFPSNFYLILIILLALILIVLCIIVIILCLRKKKKEVEPIVENISYSSAVQQTVLTNPGYSSYEEPIHFSNPDYLRMDSQPFYEEIEENIYERV